MGQGCRFNKQVGIIVIIRYTTVRDSLVTFLSSLETPNEES